MEAREIKFRAWSEELNRYSCENDCQDYGCYSSLRHEVVNGILNDEESRYIFEQYTGLKDKNGKEIYEGDVVFMPEDERFWYDSYYSKEFLNSMEVVFNNGKFKVKGEEFGYEGERLMTLQHLEVIGNIHDNPELIK